METSWKFYSRAMAVEESQSFRACPSRAENWARSRSWNQRYSDAEAKEFSVTKADCWSLLAD